MLLNHREGRNHMPTNLAKASVIFTIFLFISSVFIPCIQIQSIKAVQEQGYVDIRSEMCGVCDSGDQVVRLTREQYRLLQQYLSEFQNQFNSTTTCVEAIPLYKDLVVELAAFNLLPKGMTIQHAQNLIIQGLGMYQTTTLPMTLSQKPANSSYNIGCLISGEIDHALSYFVPAVLPGAVAYLLLLCLYEVRYNIFTHYPWDYWHRPPYPPVLDTLLTLMDQIRLIFREYYSWTSSNPFAVFNRIRFIDTFGTGRIRTVGLFGVKQWEGDLKGIIPPFNDIVIGFTGFRISNIDEQRIFFTGSALAVGVGYSDN